jgi:GH15 family glucan-1,4-alpha-glucosidase
MERELFSFHPFLFSGLANMAPRIEDHALIGDCQTAALVDRDGAIDWLCLPRFDSAACFASLLGTPLHGRWQIGPVDPVKTHRRHYLDDTLVLETEFETDGGAVALIDFMPVRAAPSSSTSETDPVPHLVRVVEGRRGRVRLRMELVIRWDYGSIIPWVRRTPEGLTAVAGPDGLVLRTPVDLHGENMTTVAEFTLEAGERIPFALSYHLSHFSPPAAIDPFAAQAETVAWWREWSSHCTYDGPWRSMVLRSLITLKALTYQPTGGIVAAATTSLPEHLGGVRNWDYRYCWLRDATFTLLSLLEAGYVEEARAWRRWLLRTVAGHPTATQIMYGLAGERRLTEWEVPWLPGYEGSRPVRIGNAASNQFQLDVYGEVLDAMFQARQAGLEPDEEGWQVAGTLLGFLESAWQQPDEGIWEVRGPRRHFTHSKVMAWVAFDRVVKAVEHFGHEGPVNRWREVRDTIHEQVCRQGFDSQLGSFVQSYGSKELDASLLMIPLVGFLPATDPRVIGTVAAIERLLLRDGFVARYDTSSAVDGLPPGEGALLPCTFWLADNLALQGRRDDAVRTFERLVGLANDVGLLSEEYDPHAGRLVGNFPQAFSHVGLVNTAFNLHRPAACPAEKRQRG